MCFRSVAVCLSAVFWYNSPASQSAKATSNEKERCVLVAPPRSGGCIAERDGFTGSTRCTRALRGFSADD